MQMIVVMGMRMTVGVGVVMGMGMGNTVMGMLVGVGMGVLVVVVTAGNMIVMDMHGKSSLSFFYHYIRSTGFCQSIYFPGNIHCPQ
jgi:hypothetical protein